MGRKRTDKVIKDSMPYDILMVMSSDCDSLYTSNILSEMFDDGEGPVDVNVIAGAMSSLHQKGYIARVSICNRKDRKGTSGGERFYIWNKWYKKREDINVIGEDIVELPELTKQEKEEALHEFMSRGLMGDSSVSRFSEVCNSIDYGEFRGEKSKVKPQ